MALSVAVLTAGASHPGPVAQAVEKSKPTWCEKKSDGSFDARKLPKSFKKSECDLSGASVSYESMGVEVPAAGEMFAEVLATDGRNYEVSVRVVDDGYVIHDPSKAPDESIPGNGGSGDPNIAACASDQVYGYSYTGAEVVSQIVWYYNNTNAPTYIANATVSAAIKGGYDGMVLGLNSCGITSRPDVSEAFGGGTPRASEVPATGNCPVGDSVSVTGWRTSISAPGGGQALAATCVQRNATNGYTVVSADVSYNSSYQWDDPSVSGCRTASSWDIEGVATHEWGHAVGLNHPDSETDLRYANQTMSFGINGPCQLSERTLGRGDMRGLELLYGYR